MLTNRVSPGQPFEPEADFFNLTKDMLRDYLRSKSLGGQPPVPSWFPNPTVIRVKNTSGAAVLRYGVLKVNAPAFTVTDSLTEFKRAAAFDGVVAQPLEPFAVLLEPLAVNKIGWAAIAGVTVAKCAFTHDKLPFADGDGIAAELEGSGDGYARVLWKESGTGTKWAVLQLGAGPRGVFPVTVEKTGGADGTQTTPATWSYTVRCKGWDGTAATLGTGVSLARPRPNGKMTFQAGSAGFGEAFYDGVTLKLWDAGEVMNLGVC